VPRILHGSISVTSLLSGEDVDRFLKLASTLRLPGWQHIDLSEARGLVLFWVVREGIGITRRLSAVWALHAYRRLGYSLSNPSISRTDPPLSEENQRRWKRLLPETLKRLASSVCFDRAAHLSQAAHLHDHLDEHQRYRPIRPPAYVVQSIDSDSPSHERHVRDYSVTYNSGT
jgi:hypothetical protein